MAYEPDGEIALLCFYDYSRGKGGDYAIMYALESQEAAINLKGIIDMFDPKHIIEVRPVTVLKETKNGL